jgi:type I restriction enzyme S subunit
MNSVMIKTSLPEICELVTDGTHDSPKLQFSGVPFIKGKHISDGRIDFENCDFITEADHQKCIKRVRPQPDDVLFSNIGSVGDAARVTGEIDFSIKNVALFRPDQQKIDPLYFYYLVISPYFRGHFLNVRSGSAQPFISLENFRSLKFNYLKSKSAQQKVGAIIAAYDDLIENNRRRIQLLEQAARLLYKEWFVRLRFPGHEHTKIINGVPVGWELKPLGDLLTLQRGFDLPVSNRQAGQVPIYASTGINGYHSVAKVNGPGVVTGRSGSLGSVTYVPGDFWPLNTALWVKEFKLVGPWFAIHLLKSMHLEQYNGGAAVPTLNRNDVHRVEVLCPPQLILQLFEGQAKDITAQIEALDKMSSKLVQARDIMLPRLMNGEIAV